MNTAKRDASIHYTKLVLLLLLAAGKNLFAQSSNMLVHENSPAMTTIDGRHNTSLNGKWQAIIDVYDRGTDRGYFRDAHSKGKSDFYEYAFDTSFQLHVPGDYNSQMPELKYYESSVWYKRSFNYDKKGGRVFLHFGAVSYITDVYLNGSKLGSHEGGFT